MQSTKSSRSSIRCLMFVSMILAGVLSLLASTIAVAQTERVLYSFQGGTDGANPSISLIADTVGNLFGTTSDGGTGPCTGGCGTVFELTPGPGGQWTKSVIYSFQGGTDGVAPAAGLIFDQAGNLYGTTVVGGKDLDGTVFKLTPSGGGWTETVLHSFSDKKDGSYPTASLIFDNAGNLYGTTLFGGHSHGGAVFKLSLSGGVWTETLLHSFTGRKDGIDPAAALIMDQNGVLYGTTMGGTLFRLTPPAARRTKWMFKTLYAFGNGPLSNGTLFGGKSGELYGTQQFGVGPANAGAVFELAPPAKHGAWTETTIYQFNGGIDGLYPYGGVIGDGAGNLYGTTSGDGQTSFGTVFKLTPPKQGSSWTKTTLYAFGGGSDGAGPGASLIFGSGGVLYGTTAGGGTSGNGTVFEIVP